MLNSYEYLNIVSSVDGLNLRDFLSEQGISSRLIRSSIREKVIYLNEVNIFENKLINKGDIVSIKFPDEELNAFAEFKKLDIIYEDEDILIVNKEPNMPTHTSKGHLSKTLINYLAGYFLERGINRKVRVVNRLDKDTSGIVIIAKNSFAHYEISKQFETNIEKWYLAIAEGHFKEKEGIIEEPIYRREDSILREVNELGKFSKTYYKVLESKGNFNLVKLRLFTGRTHQIRVHLKHIGCPILGDELYNSKSDFINRQALHCYNMVLNHPRSNKKIEFLTDIPEDMRRIFI